MQLYFGWRQYSADAICSAINPFATINQEQEFLGRGGVLGTPCIAGANIPLKDLNIGVMGARINF
jgi:hypothetical protein